MIGNTIIGLSSHYITVIDALKSFELAFTIARKYLSTEYLLLSSLSKHIEQTGIEGRCGGCRCRGGTSGRSGRSCAGGCGRGRGSDRGSGCGGDRGSDCGGRSGCSGHGGSRSGLGCGGSGRGSGCRRN
ncbi:unnamed protein product [Rotaria sp. Silwood1]|nr:unnamed protein product [Rotaria sp. Silwood1]